MISATPSHIALALALVVFLCGVINHVGYLKAIVNGDGREAADNLESRNGAFITAAVLAALAYFSR